MKFLVIALISLLVSAPSLWAKSEIKQPDTYAYTRGVEAYQEGKNQDALDWFNKELSEHPDNGYAYVYVSVLRFVNQEYGKALSAIDFALKRLPKKDKQWRSLASAYRAEVYTALGDTIKALNDLSQAIQTDPSNSQYFNNRAQLHFEQKNYSLADEDYQRMINLLTLSLGHPIQKSEA